MQSTNGVHCGNVKNDRALGELWESNFCQLLPEGCVCDLHQKDRTSSAVLRVVELESIDRGITSPDVTVYWGSSVVSHHEIKHKNPTQYGCFGLEEYRVKSLLEFMQLSGQDVYYTIHDHALSDGRYGKVNDIRHWFTRSLSVLLKDVQGKCCSPSYRNGKKTDELIYYWDRSQFAALEDVFNEIADLSGRVDF